MYINIILGLIIPWIISLIIVTERKIIYCVAPFAAVVSFIVDDFGFHYFWNLYPFKYANLSAVPFNIGLFSLYPCVIIQLLRKYNIRIYLTLPITSLILTLAEFCGLLAGRIIYFNNWNLIGTYLSYFISLLFTYSFYSVLKSQRLI